MLFLVLQTPTIFKTGPKRKGPYIKYRPEEFGIEKDEKFQPAKPFLRNLQCKYWLNWSNKWVEMNSQHQMASGWDESLIYIGNRTSMGSGIRPSM